MNERRARFRAYMEAMNPTARSSWAVEHGYFVDTPNNLASLLVPRLEIQPASTHLVVGTIGSGKTTQLLVTQSRLRQASDVLAPYIDLGREHDLRSLQTGVLLAAAGVALLDTSESSQWPEDAKAAAENFRRFALGHFSWTDNYYDAEPPGFWRPGMLEPEWTLDESLVRPLRQLQMWLSAAVAPGTHPCVLVDALDRADHLPAVISVLTQDVPALASIGIGVVVVAPLAVVYGLDHAVAANFEYIYRQPAFDIESDPAALESLRRVLERRLASVEGDSIVDADVPLAMMRASGGVLRDLLHIARQSGDIAYIDGAQTISTSHVASAVDNFGRQRLLGVTADDVALFQAISAGKGFTPTTSEHLKLLATCRILEYGGPVPRYALHPAIAALLSKGELGAVGAAA